MQNTIEQIIDQLQHVEPDEYGDCVEQLNRIFDGFQFLPGKELAIPAMLSLIERYPDADMGSPGPLVHEMEGIPGYERHLKESLARAPAALSCWMANRILNAKHGAAREHWLELLQQVVSNPGAPQSAKAEALAFISFQQPVG